MALYGGMSKGERNRIKIRVRSAMSAQAAMEGRFLGGRPPYGYQLADAGPHPNPGKAADGKRLHRLEPEPSTAPVVQRIYREYLTGTGIYAIAEGLTRDGILSPSAADPRRNRHRSVQAWGKSAVRVILTNPRYTGREVWNKQRKTEVLLDVEDVALGHETKMRWNPERDWIYSQAVVHEGLIDDDTFQQAQTRIAAVQGLGEHGFQPGGHVRGDLGQEREVIRVRDRRVGHGRTGRGQLAGDRTRDHRRSAEPGGRYVPHLPCPSRAGRPQWCRKRFRSDHRAERGPSGCGRSRGARRCSREQGDGCGRGPRTKEDRTGRVSWRRLRQSTTNLDLAASGPSPDRRSSAGQMLKAPGRRAPLDLHPAGLRAGRKSDSGSTICGSAE